MNMNLTNSNILTSAEEEKSGLRRSFGAMLCSEIDDVRSSLFVRAQYLVLAGYLMVTGETFISIRLGLTGITYRETLVVSLCVVVSSFFFIAITGLIRRIKLWQEWLIFGLYLSIFLLFFTIWTYKLGQLRILAMLNVLAAITVVIYYAGIFQSLLMSITSLIALTGTILYSTFAEQHGSCKTDLFIALCLFPAVALISCGAYYIRYRREEALRVKHELESLNRHLTEVNSILQEEQEFARIEMELAGEIQSNFFPSEPPDTVDWDVAFRSMPNSGVSGDFYDFYYDGNNLSGISLFDVSGHGVAPGLITILAKPVLYRFFRKFSANALETVIDESNRVLYDQLEQVHIFITGVMLRLNGPDVEYVNAGHPDIILKSASAGVRACPVDNCLGGFKGQPIGINRETKTCGTLRFSVESGDTILMYSDGLADCRNSSGEYYGHSRLLEAFSSLQGDSAPVMLDKLMSDFYDFAGGNSVTDDITVIVARKK